MFRRPFVVGLVIGLAACGGDAVVEDQTTQAPPVETTVTATTVEATRTTVELAGTTTTATPETTSTAAVDTTTTATSAAAAVSAQAASTLEDGRPATFLAITEDYVAVEVDTLTGDVAHVFGQTGTSAGVAAAEEMAPNVLVGVWRVLDGSMVGLTDCCEPASGRIFYVNAGDQLGPDPYVGPATAGWTLSPSPVSNNIATVGYALVVSDPNVNYDTGPGQWINEPELGFPDGGAAWTRDGSELYWVTHLDGAAGLATLDLAEGSPTPIGVLDWVADNQEIYGIGSQASGNLVGFLNTRNAEYVVTETVGVVFSPTGELLANFPIETGSTWGGYDASGVFLIYTDSAGSVRWQGAGDTGVLGGGYIFASW